MLWPTYEEQIHLLFRIWQNVAIRNGEAVGTNLVSILHFDAFVSSLIALFSADLGPFAMTVR